jgi:small subunit ribosomal protein S20
MPNIRSSKKDVRRTLARTQRNRAAKSRIRTFRKSALEALKKGDVKAAQAAYDKFSSAADKAAKGNTIHKNTASRLKSRMARKFKSAAANA